MRQKRFALTSCGIFRQAALLAACLVAGAQATTYNVNTTNMGLVNARRGGDGEDGGPGKA